MGGREGERDGGVGGGESNLVFYAQLTIVVLSGQERQARTGIPANKRVSARDGKRERE